MSSVTVVVSLDAGRVQMATHYERYLNVPMVVMHKNRENGTETKVTRVIGKVRDRSCLIVDDMISTGGTIVKSVEALLKAGARPEITVAAVHGVLLKRAQAKLNHGSIRAIYVTDTTTTSDSNWTKLHVVSIAPLIVAVIEKLSEQFP